ncbi:MAG: F0F1 ATP synthase subunit gamma [Endomicrobium sp.]|jgi:F-type H+-transporting ATPase subunit gamma|nr:F0F1 ATP synthase subunit gamma [Endomicrobium sp.]
MKNLQYLKRRIKTSNSVSKIAKAIEMISVSKIHKSQEIVKRYGLYANKVKDIVYRVIFNRSLYNENCEYKRLVYIISPDRGLVGNLIMNLIKKVNSYLKSNDYVIIIGRKIMKDIIKYGHNVLMSFDMPTVLPKYTEIGTMINIANKFFITKKVNKICMIYTKFINVFVQKSVIEEIFSVKSSEFKSTVNYIFEPNFQFILQNLLPFYLNVGFYNALVNAYTSEQAARMIAMKTAKDNANDILIYLTNIYNKSRQEKITNEILDLVNGQEF